MMAIFLPLMLFLKRLRVIFVTKYGWLFVFMLTPISAYSAILRHNILENHSADTTQSQGLCQSFKSTTKRLICLPLPYAPQKTGQIQINLGLKANEDAIELIRRANDRDVDKDYLDRLFKDSNFQSASGSTNVLAAYRNTGLSYTPLQFAGAFKLVNPSLPFVHLKSVNQSVFRLSHYFIFDNWIGNDYGEIIFAPSVFYYRRFWVKGDFDLLSITGKKVDKLIKKTKKTGQDADASISLLSKHWFLPGVTLKVSNIAAGTDCETCDSDFFNLESHYLTNSSISSYFSVSHPIGQSLLGASMPFWGVYEDLDVLKIAGSYIFRLSKLHSFVSMSPLMRSFGFMFEAENYRVGIQYTNEKQDNSFQLQRVDQTYVFASFFI